MAKKVLAAAEAAKAEEAAEAQADDLTPLSAEELRRLPPETRVARLRALEAARRKELEETRRKVEREIEAAQDLIEETEEEVEEERTVRRQEREHPPEEPEPGESLEERVARERTAAAQQEDRQYRTGAEYRTPGQEDNRLYGILENAATRLEQLYGVTDWNDRQLQEYRDAKETVERARSYNLTSDKLREEFGTAENVLKRLQYR